jgi:hypothetical protein
MTTAVLYGLPRDLGTAQLARAIARHCRVPVSTETLWEAGRAEMRIDLGGTSADVAVYAVELYTLVLGVRYAILDDGDNPQRHPQRNRVVASRTIG